MEYSLMDRIMFLEGFGLNEEEIQDILNEDFSKYSKEDFDEMEKEADVLMKEILEMDKNLCPKCESYSTMKILWGLVYEGNENFIRTRICPDRSMCGYIDANLKKVAPPKVKLDLTPLPPNEQMQDNDLLLFLKKAYPDGVPDLASIVAGEIEEEAENETEGR